MAVSLFLLGQLLAKSHQDRVLGLSSRKAQALLAYLATEGARPHYREALSGLLWPEHPDQAARSSLRQAIHALRLAIGDDTAATPLLLISRETIQINPEAGFWLDVAVFEGATASSPLQCNSSMLSAHGDVLRSAVALYRGPFLDGLTLGDSPAFEEWLLLKREQINRRMLLALHLLASFYEESLAYDEALAFARRAIELEPWQEEAHQQVMRILALAGRRGEALIQYRRCRDLMAQDLGVEPGPETRALYDRIRDGTISRRLVQPPTTTYGRAISLQQPVVEKDVVPPSLVARAQELARLTGFLSQACAGEGRVALVTGDAGSGKTTLVEEFARQSMAENGDLLVAVGRCSAQMGAGDAYQPCREILRMLAGDLEGILNPRHARRLQAALPLAFESLVQQGPDLVRLLGRDFPSMASRARACAPRDASWLAHLETLTAQVADLNTMGLQQAALCAQVTQVMRAISHRQPLLLILDDLQWADAPSLDMLFHLGRHLQESRILIVGALRLNEADRHAATEQHTLAGILDEFQRQWGDIRVDMAEAEGRAFVEAYLDSQPNRLGARFRETLAHHTGGNALFTVELVRAMQERGHLLRDGQGRWAEGPGLDWEKLPARVEAVISQRIRHLTAAQSDLLEIASVEGGEFHAEVLARVRGLSVAEVVASLSGPLSRQAHLVTPGSLVTVGERHLARYHFRHGLFQSYLYGQLDGATRAHLHGAVGAALQELYGENEPQSARQLAQHFEAAGEAEKAANYLLQAGRQAVQVGAHREAITCYERALSLLAGLPTAPERTELEFALLMALDHSLLFTLGWGAPERMRATGRAYELGQTMGRSTPAMLRALRGLANLHAGRGEYERAICLAGELLAAGENAHAPLYVASAHAVLAMCATMQGDLTQAWAHAEQAMAFSMAPPHLRTADELFTLRPHADVVAVAVLTSRGYLDQATQQMERITSVEDWITVEMTGFAHSIAALFYALCHEDRKAQQQAEEALRIIGSKDVPEVQALGQVVLGWAEARAGQFREGIERLTAALAAQPAQSTLAFRFLQRVLLVEACLAGGDTGAAYRTVEDALSQAEKTGTHYHLAQLWRLRGEVLLQAEQATAGNARLEAETCLQRAIEVARQQGARLYELRATRSLARLWAQEGRIGEAREALAAIYATFSEGFDTPDLIEARALLDALRIQVVRPV
ncbi:MAG: ATP-binding protein [Anaerolineae bacterium]